MMKVSTDLGCVSSVRAHFASVIIATGLSATSIKGREGLVVSQSNRGTLAGSLMRFARDAYVKRAHVHDQ